MTATREQRIARPASGIAIDPVQLTKMRDLYPLTRQELAERAGELLFDREAFDAVLAGRLDADARLARKLWLALGTTPESILTGLPPDIPRAEVPKWLAANAGWRLDLTAVRQWLAVRGWGQDDLAAAVSRRWFSRDAVNKQERGERRPRGDTLRAYCAVLGCKPADLMPGSAPLPEGATAARKAALDHNNGMRAYADEHGISYRTPAGRIDYSDELRDAYAEYLIAREGRVIR